MAHPLSPLQQKAGFNREQGAALLIVVVVLLMAGASVFAVLYSPSSRINQDAEMNGKALAEAKEALVAWAATAAGQPGGLPCPDTDNDGESNWSGPACSSYIGRFPWMTLGVADLRDASGERL